MSQRSTAQHCDIDTPFCTIRKSHVTWNFAVPEPHSEEIRRCTLLFLCTLDAHNSSLIGRRPQFGSVTRSWIWIRALRMAFSSSLEFGYVVLGLFFPFPNSQSTWQVRQRCLIAADTDRRSHSTLPPGTMSSILFAKHVSFEHSVSSPRPVITSRREKRTTRQTFFSTQSTVIVSPLHPAWSARTSRPVLSESAAVLRVS